MQKKLANQLLHFYQQLKPPPGMPHGIKVLYPQQNPEVMELVKKFLSVFYNDLNSRRIILGINPGRFGAGITGINFTAPKQLKEYCGIDHSLGNSSELSAEFIYEVIVQYGGAKEFYHDWFLGAVCPLGFIKGSKNINYYDDKDLLKAVNSFIIENIHLQLSFNFKTDYCICIGGEKNYRYISGLNEQNNWFQKIVPLPHPRFIMQYRRKEKDKYIHEYLTALNM